MGKTALITGASRGIGRATAELLARQGFAVAINYVQSQRAAEELAAALRAQGADAAAFQADVADLGQVEAMISAVEKRLGPVQVLVNNAGIAAQRLFTDITPAEWNAMLGVHVNGAYHCCRCVLPSMIREKRGKIVNVSSIWGITGASCEVHYSTAKAAIIGLTKALAKEVGPSGIQVNCVAPGVVDTDMLAGFDEAARRALMEETPLGRLGTPEETAAAIAFLASDAADFITGQVLGVNGGFLI